MKQTWFWIPSSWIAGWPSASGFPELSPVFATENMDSNSYSVYKVAVGLKWGKNKWSAQLSAQPAHELKGIYSSRSSSTVRGRAGLGCGNPNPLLVPSQRNWDLGQQFGRNKGLGHLRGYHSSLVLILMLLEKKKKTWKRLYNGLQEIAYR